MIWILLSLSLLFAGKYSDVKVDTTTWTIEKRISGNYYWGADTTTHKIEINGKVGYLDMGDYRIMISSSIEGLSKIIWADGTVQVSSPTVGGIESESYPIFTSSAPVTYLYKTEKAADSDKLDGYDYTAFVSTSGDTMEGTYNVSNAIFNFGDSSYIKINDSGNLEIRGTYNSGNGDLILKGWGSSGDVSLVPSGSGTIDLEGSTRFTSYVVSNITFHTGQQNPLSLQWKDTSNNVVAYIKYDRISSPYKLQITTVSLKGSLYMNNYKITDINWKNSDRDLEGTLFTNVSTSPVNDSDVSTKGYTDYAIKNATSPLLSKSSATVTYLFKNEKASDSDKLDGLDSLDFIKKDGSVSLTSNWNAGEYKIQINTISAVSSKGLYLLDDSGNGIFVKDGGNIGINNTSPNYKLDINGDIHCTEKLITSEIEVSTITFSDGTILTSTSTLGSGNGGGTGGDPDIIFDYSGDIFNSTVTYPNGIGRVISKYSFTVSKYDIFIGSTTTDSFDIVISTASLGGSWAVAETITVPAGVSSHTYTSSGYTIKEGTVVSFGFQNVDASSPAGDVTIKIGD